MKYCVNPYCSNPQNSELVSLCQSCGSGLLLNHRFRPIEMIGKGGFGRIFKAIDEHDVNESKCLVKQFFVENQQQLTTAKQINLSDDTIIRGHQAIDKLQDIHRQEVEQLNRLKHPQIPKLITNFEQDGYSYLVQEFIEGTNLKTELERQGAFKEEQIWQLLHELLPVIKYIHTNKIIHRDIKPENIIRPKGNKKLVLVDFGAAKLVAPNYSKEQTDIQGITAITVIGTLNYIAPEQNNGRVVFASDLYSLGVTCIVLITNKNPDELFDDGTHSWNWKNHCKKVSRKLTTILDKLIEFGTSNRYQSVDEVLKDIGKQIIETNIQNTSDNISKWHKVQIISAVIGTFAALIGAANVLGWINNNNSTEISKAIDKVAIKTSEDINYQNLILALRNKNWKLADQETYEILLELGGKKSQSKGWINHNTIDKLSCTDLKTIDDLWRAASDGKLGFSSQQIIYEEQGFNWQKFYEQVQWGYIADGQLKELIEQEIDWKNRKRKYKADKIPNFVDPVPGHLPVTKRIVKGIAFPQFADICQF